MPLLNKNKKEKPAPKTGAKVTIKKSTEEEIAAIAAAIFLHTQQQIHDSEDYKMTIRRVDVPYSPWSSKNHIMRKWPHRK